MTRLGEIRLTLLVFATAAGAMLIGWPLLQLGLAEAGDTASSESLRRLVGRHSIGGLAALAVVRAGANNPEERKRDIAALLALAPSSGGGWLDLAIARRAAGEKTEDVVAALALSSLMGPHESLLMAARGKFALPFWSALPSEAKGKLVADLVGGWGSFYAGDRETLAAILEFAPDGSGDEIRRALSNSGYEGQKVAAALTPTPKGSAAASTCSSNNTHTDGGRRC